MSTIPSKQLAVGITSSTSGIVSFEVPVLEPSKNEALVRVNWAALSYFELWQVDFGLIAQYPQVLGINLAGEVVKAGEDSDVQVGDSVISFGMSNSQERALQEYALVSKYKIGKVILPEA